MEYGELLKTAEANLKAKGILKSYSVEEGSSLRPGPETNFVGRFNLRYFERFGFKFRMIDSEEASTEITLFNRKFKTPILSGALSGMADITEKPLVKDCFGSQRQRFDDVGGNRLFGTGEGGIRDRMSNSENCQAV